MNKNKFSSFDLITLFLLIIVYAIAINFLIDAGTILCAVCSTLFVIVYIVCTVIDNLFENEKLNNILRIVCFILLVLIVITFLI